MVAWTVSTVLNRVAKTVNTREKAKNMVTWTVSTIENRVAQTGNTRERTNNNGGLNSSIIYNRVAQTVNTRGKAKNMVAWTVSTIELIVSNLYPVHVESIFTVLSPIVSFGSQEKVSIGFYERVWRAFSIDFCSFSFWCDKFLYRINGSPPDFISLSG